ncbi:protein TIC 40, chloroplastic isoform X1 [Triticum urartu]|uniref:protein TIC 40, chloroplastic isoform X1 n=1 Tax=Triticum urartu TaxID=4572 RepID=UPI0020441DE2|nr:protein TIC 40, chloroplastic isoform X1 [Triticum urartu]
MESLVLASSCSASPRLPLLSAASRPSRPLPAAPLSAAAGRRGARRPRLVVSAASRGSRNVSDGFNTKGFASISSSTSTENTSTGTGTVPPMPPPSSYIGSPVFWIGVGVALSAAFSMVSSMVKKYAMEQAFKSMMTQAPPNTFGANSPFPFSMPPQAGSTAPSSYPYSGPRKNTPKGATVDVSATDVAATGSSEAADVAETLKPSKKFAFVDVSPEELQKQKELQSSLQTVDVKSDSTESETKGDTEQVPTNGAAFKPSEDSSTWTTESSKSGPMLSIDTIEKMMEDPAVQKMVYPYLPEEMRNPDSFKSMLQNPMYRQQLEDMLNNMGASPDQWDNRMVDHLKNFDLSSPEVRQQFAQVGMTPEEVVAKIMANPEVAVAFQNPKIQTAIMDCSQNPLNIVKYQNDQEVMDVFMKISQIFPQING